MHTFYVKFYKLQKGTDKVRTCPGQSKKLWTSKMYNTADKDRSKYVIVYVYEEGIFNKRFFFYPKYGIAIEISSNSIWCWLTQAVHGTSKLDLSEDGIRYTATITLTEKWQKL